jgi:hypothetical protein
MDNLPYWKTDKFKKLDAKWQKKLADKGFRDIEYRVNGEPADYMVGPNPEYFIRRYSPDKEQYYQNATTWGHHLRRIRAGRQAYKIWDQHTEGKSYSEIVKATQISRGIVARVVQQQKKAMLKAIREALPPFSTDDDYDCPTPEE